jgi:excisionase family DNA binding protein
LSLPGRWPHIEMNTMNTMNTTPIQTRAMVAARLGVCVRTVDEWLKRQMLPATRLGRAVRIDAAACEVFKAERTVQALAGGAARSTRAGCVPTHRYVQGRWRRV